MASYLTYNWVFHESIAVSFKTFSISLDKLRVTRSKSNSDFVFNDVQNQQITFTFFSQRSDDHNKKKTTTKTKDLFDDNKASLYIIISQKSVLTWTRAIPV